MRLLDLHVHQPEFVMTTTERPLASLLVREMARRGGRVTNQRHEVVTLDERVLRALRVKAARTGRRDSEVIEEALRRDLGLELLERIWAKADLGEDEALSLAVKEQHTARRR